MLKKFSNNDRQTQAILDLYSERTGIPSAYIDRLHKTIIWQSNQDHCSPLCKLMQEINPNLCREDHHNRAPKNERKLVLCHAGLWNYMIPIQHEEKSVGLIITGQRRLKGGDQGSLEKLSKLKIKIDPKHHQEIDKCFDETHVIDRGEFDSNLLTSLKTVEEMMLNAVSINNHERLQIINLAHEFLLPIQAIIANADFISNEAKSESIEIINRSEEIIRLVTKLAKIAENMRSSLMSTGRESYNFKSSKMLKIIEENVSIFKTEAEKKGIIFKIDVPENLFLPVSRVNISRCFFNLIHNSVKYSYKSVSKNLPRFIEIKAEKDGLMYNFSISNYGIGILEEEMTDILKIGIRGKLSKDRERTGSGLGLSESKKIIDAHNGELEIKSIILGNDKKDRLNSPYMTIVSVKLPIVRSENVQ